jgi:hypothetical protein
MIQYPIDKANQRFTTYDTVTSSPALDGKGNPSVRREWPSEDVTQMVPGLAATRFILEDITDPQPAYDPATQKLVPVPTVYDVPNESATDSWSVVELTPAELLEMQEEEQHQANTPPRSVVTKLKNGNATSLETQKTVAWCARQLMGPVE